MAGNTVLGLEVEDGNIIMTSGPAQIRWMIANHVGMPVILEHNATSPQGCIGIHPLSALFPYTQLQRSLAKGYPTFRIPQGIVRWLRCQLEMCLTYQSAPGLILLSCLRPRIYG